MKEQRKDQIKIVKKDFTIPEQAFSDIDDSIINYFKKTIGLYVVENNEKVVVPIVLGTSERWAQIKKERTHRDSKKKLTLPLGRLNRTNTAHLKDMFVPQAFGNVITVYKKIAKENEWKSSNTTSAINVKNPIAIAYDINVPPAIEISYDLTFWTRFVKSMDFIEEQIMINNSVFSIQVKDYYYLIVEFDGFSNNSNTDDFSDDLRLINATANMSVKGYIYSEMKNQKANIRKVYSPSTITFTERVT